MHYKKIFLTTVAGLLFSSVAFAQNSDKGELKSYNFIEVQGGAQMTLTDAKMDKLITPVGAFSLGRYFTPGVGARLHVNGWQAKSGFDDLGYYKWNYITTDLDLLLNLTNLFSKNKSGAHPLNVILLGGVGLTHAWDNDEALVMASANRDRNMQLAWDDNRLSHNIRAGLRLETNVTKPVGLSLEINANSLDDRFNSKMNDADDWQISALLGLSIRFGHKYKKAPVVVEPVPVVEPEPAPKPEPKTYTVIDTIYKKVPVKLHEVKFYNIRESDPEAKNAIMDRIADFLNTYPEATVSIVGYADKGTGTPAINKKYALQRAETFKNELVKKYNINASRIVTDSKGDTVQPFEENDKNRCVIVDGSAEKTVMETKSRTVTE